MWELPVELKAPHSKDYSTYIMNAHTNGPCCVAVDAAEIDPSTGNVQPPPIKRDALGETKDGVL
jgi:hypothetical protein